MTQHYLRGGNFPKSIAPHVKDLLEIIYADDPAGFWYFYGSNGCGKTHILAAAVNEAIKQQHSAIYTTTTQLLFLLRDDILEGDFDRAGALKQLKTATVLAIDDLGRERSIPHAMEKLFQTLDSRYRSAHNLDAKNPAMLTIMGGNLPPNELDPYLQSRLLDQNSRVVTMQNIEDRRKRNATLAAS